MVKPSIFIVVNFLQKWNRIRKLFLFGVTPNICIICNMYACTVYIFNFKFQYSPVCFRELFTLMLHQEWKYILCTYSTKKCLEHTNKMYTYIKAHYYGHILSNSYLIKLNCPPNKYFPENYKKNVCFMRPLSICLYDLFSCKVNLYQIKFIYNSLLVVIFWWWL